MKNGYLFQSGENYHLNSLEQKELFFSHPNAFNDPYDCNIEIHNDLDGDLSIQNHEINDLKNLFKKNYRGGLEGKWDSAFLSNDLANKIVEWCNDLTSSYVLVDEIREHIAKRLGVRCMFKDKPNKVLMWAHYANNHTGYCLEYSMPWDVSKDVTYGSQHSQYYLSEFLFSSRTILNSLLQYKDKSWAYENETRIVRLNLQQAKPAAAGFSLPLSKLKCNLESIYLGASMKDETEEKMIQISKKLGVKLFKCQKDDYVRSEFSLVPVEVFY